jgi:hypothetical protein
MGANQSVDAPHTQWFVETNATLLACACVRHSILQALFIPFSNDQTLGGSFEGVRNHGANVAPKERLSHERVPVNGGPSGP